MMRCTGELPKGLLLQKSPNNKIRVLPENTDLAQNFMIIMTTRVMQKKKIFMVSYLFFFFFQSIFPNPKDNLCCQLNKMKRFGFLPQDKPACPST